mmetsp:Transcript_12695/g.19157  ORF Transcript_12695/g.19157 Transcript_12695/m.19157 type:complete len:176 (-) Transcript_12695:64-591(-)
MMCHFLYSSCIRCMIKGLMFYMSITDEMGFFKAVSNQMAIYGAHYSIEELKESLIKYEKENAEDLQSSQFLNININFTEYVEKLERNERIIEAFDVDCMSKLLGAEISVFYPDFKNKLDLGEVQYNPQNSEQRIRRIAVVHDSTKFPIRTYSAMPVWKKCLTHNPYNAVEEKVGL